MKKLILLALAVIVGLCYSLPASAQQQQGDKKFEVSGEVRFRADHSDNATDLVDATAGTGSPGDDSGLVWPWRVRAAIHGSFSRNVSGHVEFQSYGAAGDGGNGVLDASGSSGLDTCTALPCTDDATTQLYQGWLELGDIGGTSFDLRLGRQELVYGSEMLLGDNDFYNGTNHDGARAAWQYKKWSLDTWYTNVVESAGFGGEIFPTSQPSDDTTFYGGYAVFKMAKAVGFDAYAMVAKDGAIIKEERTTIGGRVYNKADSNWNWWAELALQSGEFDSGVATTDISASGFEGEISYQFRKAKVKPRIHLRYSAFTGEDDDPDESEAFDPLFQDAHGRYGKFDLFRATNLNALQVGVSWNGKEDRHIFGVNLIQLTLNEEIDADPAAGIQGEDDLGQELDLYYKYAYSKNVDIVAAIASFSPGDVFDNASGVFSPGLGATAPDIGAAGDDSARRVYVNTRLRF